MQKVRPTYAFDVEGHTVVTPAREQECTFGIPGRIIAGGAGITVCPEKKRKAHTPEWLSQALNEGDGVYRP